MIVFFFLIRGGTRTGPPARAEMAWAEVLVW